MEDARLLALAVHVTGFTAVGAGPLTGSRMPPDAWSVPCQKPKKTRVEFRDCARPDMKQSLSERWIGPPTGR